MDLGDWPENLSMIFPHGAGSRRCGKSNLSVCPLLLVRCRPPPADCAPLFSYFAWYMEAAALWHSALGAAGSVRSLPRSETVAPLECAHTASHKDCALVLYPRTKSEEDEALFRCDFVASNWQDLVSLRLCVLFRCSSGKEKSLCRCCFRSPPKKGRQSLLFVFLTELHRKILIYGKPTREGICLMTRYIFYKS